MPRRVHGQHMAGQRRAGRSDAFSAGDEAFQHERRLARAGHAGHRRSDALAECALRAACTVMACASVSKCDGPFVEQERSGATRVAHPHLRRCPPKTARCALAGFASHVGPPTPWAIARVPPSAPEPGPISMRWSAWRSTAHVVVHHHDRVAVGEKVVASRRAALPRWRGAARWRARPARRARRWCGCARRA